MSKDIIIKTKKETFLVNYPKGMKSETILEYVGDYFEKEFKDRAFKAGDWDHLCGKWNEIKK